MTNIVAAMAPDSYLYLIKNAKGPESRVIVSMFRTSDPFFSLGLSRHSIFAHIRYPHSSIFVSSDLDPLAADIHRTLLHLQ